MSRAGKLPDRSIARNLLCEHRVSEARFQHFAGFSADPFSFDLLRDKLVEYRETHVLPAVTSRLTPDYLRTENSNNMVPPRQDMELATVIDLSRLGMVFWEAGKSYGIPVFENYSVTNPRDSAQIQTFDRVFWA